MLKRLLVLFLLAGLFLTTSALAQSTLGSIVGSVHDASGAVVPQSTVSVRNVDENVSQTRKSNDSGEFLFLNLNPGNYEVTAEKEGFEHAHSGSFHLEARQERRIALHLSVKSVGQVVDVNDIAAAINTENATIADSKDGQQVATLPVNYRGSGGPLAALVAAPGVQQDANGQLSIGGGLPSTIDYSLDGISTTNVRVTGANGNMYPSTELIGEFRVSAVNNNAEFAQVGDVTVTTKSGGNHYHGSVFEYLQNRALDATTWGAPSKQGKVFNTFGGSFGGPVVLDHIYDGHNRTFFFTDFERNSQRGTTLQESYVPTNDEWAGLGSAVAGSPVANVSPVATKISQYYPRPNRTINGDDHYNYTNRPKYSTSDGIDGRLDEVINSRQQLFGRYSWKSVALNGWNGISSTSQSTLLPASTLTESDNSFLISHTFTIRPNLLNEFRFGASIWNQVEKFPINGVAIDTALFGSTFGGMDLSQHPGAGAFPVFNFSTGTNYTPIGRQKDGPTQSTVYQYADNLSWTKGRHTLKFGVDYRRLAYKDVEHFAPADDFGDFSFYGNFTGNAFQDFLQGLPNDNAVAVTGPNLDSRAKHIGLYAQDEWHLNSRITLSYGLRWEFHPPFTEQKGNLANFDPATDSVIIPNHGLAPATAFLQSINYCGNASYQNPAISQCSKVETASQAGLGPGLRAAYFKNFDPRIGIAWRPFGDEKTVLRAGFGIFTATNLGPQSFLLSGISTAAFIDYVNYTAPGAAPQFSFPQAITTSSGANPLEGTIGYADFEIGLDTHLRDAESAQWNISVERELPGQIGVRASYIGMNTYRLMNVVDVNQVRPSAIPYSSTEKPFQNWGQLFVGQNNAGANYQSFQLQATHPASHGLFFQGTYTFAKNLTNAEGTGPTGFPGMWGGQFTDRFNTHIDRGNDFGDRRQRLLLTGIYQLPFGRGQRFLSGSHGLTETLFGGWKLSTITLLQTGPFLTPTYVPQGTDPLGADPLNINLPYDLGVTNLNGGEPSIRPDRIASGKVKSPSASQWIDPRAFVAIQQPGREGTSGVGILTGPGTIAVAGGLAKEFALTEGAKLRFESTFTNLLNHANLSAPNTVWNSGAFGVITSVQSSENAANRTGQLALRLEF